MSYDFAQRHRHWNCTSLEGSKSCYEFAGLAGIEDGEHNTTINMRFLPCPCSSCYDNKPEECLNIDIVGEVKRSNIYYKPSIDCPDNLTEPLENLKNDMLLTFIKKNGIKCASRVKRDMCVAIRQFWEHNIGR